jgi:hypothetical protein
MGLGLPYGCKIIRKNGLPNNALPYEIIGITSGFDSTYIDTNVMMDSTYTYAVIAFNVFGNSDTSNIETVTIDPVTSIQYNHSISEFSFFHNYPNPFNPTTNIKYQILEISLVTLKVYDVLGNEIATLVNEEKPVGSYEVEFDGIVLPSGIYFYQLSVGDPKSSSGQGFVETKKMILLK